MVVAVTVGVLLPVVGVVVVVIVVGGGVVVVVIVVGGGVVVVVIVVVGGGGVVVGGKLHFSGTKTKRKQYAVNPTVLNSALSQAKMSLDLLVFFRTWLNLKLPAIQTVCDFALLNFDLI